MKTLRDTSADPPDDSDLPSWGVRTAVSFLLFIHLFFLGAGVISNFGVRNLEDVKLHLVGLAPIRNYLTLLNMYTAYNYSEVIGMADDWDQEVLIALDVPQNFEGRPEELKDYRLVKLMPESVWPGIRKKRMLELGHNIARFTNDPDRETVLPDALADGMLNTQVGPPKEIVGKLTRHRFICREIPIPGLYPNPDGAGLPSERTDAIPATNVYQADVAPAGNQWIKVKVAGKGEATRSKPGSRSGQAPKPKMGEATPKDGRPADATKPPVDPVPTDVQPKGAE